MDGLLVRVVVRKGVKEGQGFLCVFLSVLF